MTYHSTVSGLALMGLAGGLGGDPRGHEVLIRFRPGPGLSSATSQPVLKKLKEILSGTQLFYANIEVGWGAASTFYARTVVKPGAYAKITLRRVAELMPGIAEDAVAGTGYTLAFDSIKDEDSNEYIAASALRAPVQPTPGEGLYTPDKPPSTPGPVSPSFTPPQAPASVTMTVKQLQQRLIAAGVNVRGGADGRWGSGTRTAFESFASARGITMPTLGSRSDYVQSGSNVTIPAAVAAALPAASGGGGGGSSGGGGGGGGGGGSPQPAPDVTPDVPGPVTPDSDYGGGVREEKSELPWPWIGAGVGVVALLGVWYLSRRKAS